MRILSVWLNDTLVGSISNLADDRNLFAFDEAYLHDPDAPILSLGYFDAHSRLVPTSMSGRTADPFFANLLPEGKLREYLAERDGVSPERDFPLLAVLGGDLPGAVILREEQTIGTEPSIVDEVKKHVGQEREFLLRFSLAGVQLKFSAIATADGGLTIPTSGGRHIIKLPSTRWNHVPENEWSMMHFAQSIGMEVPPFHLAPVNDIENLPHGIGEKQFKGKQAFVIRRFDRPEERRVHIEDFAQVFRIRPERKYKDASYGSIARALNVADTGDVAEFIRRLVFSIGIGNADAHLKNWSLIYEDDLSPRLSPVYDLVSTIQYIEDDQLALSIAGTKDWAEISWDLLERFARRAGIATGIVKTAASRTVEAMNQGWRAIKDDLPITNAAKKKIEVHQRQIPLFNGRVQLVKTLVDDEDAAQPEIA